MLIFKDKYDILKTKGTHGREMCSENDTAVTVISYLLHFWVHRLYIWITKSDLRHKSEDFVELILV